LIDGASKTWLGIWNKVPLLCLIVLLPLNLLLCPAQLPCFGNPRAAFGRNVPLHLGRFGVRGHPRIFLGLPRQIEGRSVSATTWAVEASSRAGVEGGIISVDGCAVQREIDVVGDPCCEVFGGEQMGFFALIVLAPALRVTTVSHGILPSKDPASDLTFLKPQREPAEGGPSLQNANTKPGFGNIM
jgi:hypothetical protein